jgi:hypothetical protein
MSNVTLFEGKKFKLPAMPAGFEDSITKTIAGGSGSGNRRISIKGKAFRQVVNGEEIYVSEDRTLDVILVNAAPVARQYYEGAYDPKATAVPPTCWSSDTQKPDAAVPEDQRQSDKCMTCPNNIKGSGQGESRACRFSQRVAVLLDGDIEKKEVYQLQLPATSVFGDGKDGKMGLQAYGKFLAANSVHAISVVTRMKFDVASEQPKLSFSAVRPLDQEELETALEMRDSPEAKEAITMTVGAFDGEKAPRQAAAAEKAATKKKVAPVVEEEDEEEAPAPKAKKKAAPVVEEDDDEPAPAPKKKAAPVVEEDDEPVVRNAKKSAPKEEPAGDLDDLLGEWDD